MLLISFEKYQNPSLGRKFDHTTGGFYEQKPYLPLADKKTISLLVVSFHFIMRNEMGRIVFSVPHQLPPASEHL